MRVATDHLEIAPSALVLEVVQITAVSPAIVRRPRVPANVSCEVTYTAPRPDSLENEPETTSAHPVAVLPEKDRLVVSFGSITDVVAVPIQRSRRLASDPHLPRAVAFARSCTHRQRQLSEVDVADRQLTKFVQPQTAIECDKNERPVTLRVAPAARRFQDGLHFRIR